MSWTTPPTFVAGPPAVTAAQLNILSGDLTTLGTWTTYTPTLTNLTIGNGTTTGRCILGNKTIVFEVQVTVGTSTAFSASQVAISLPATAARTNWTAGDSLAFDTSANAWYDIDGIATSTTTVSIRCPAGTAGNALQIVNQSAPFTWAAGDVLTVAGRYEAA